MKRNTRIGAGVVAGAAAVTVAAVVALALPATADETSTPSPASSAPSSSAPCAAGGEHEGRGRGPGGSGETPLTGDDAARATEAAQEAVEGGTVLRVETDSDGVYEAHVRKADGTEVEVKMDKDFTVTSVEELSGGHHGRGPGGPAGDRDEDGAGSSDTATATPSTSA